MDLLQRQVKLQMQATKIIEEMNLINGLEKIGKSEIIGSLKLGLMTWRDIDIEVVTKDLKKEKIVKLINQLLKMPSKRMDFSIMDNRDKQKVHFPKGIYLGLKYFGDVPVEFQTTSTHENVWKIDIWFLLEQNKVGSLKTLELKDKISAENILPILKIKHEFDGHPKYKKDFTSLDIYEAVIDKGVKNKESFVKYLSKKGIKV